MKISVIVSFAKSGWSVGISVLVCVFTFYLLHEFTQIRAGLAIALIYLAVRSLLNGSYTKFILFTSLAIGFHNSALMAFLLLLPYRGSVARWIDFWLLVVAGSTILLAMNGVDIGTALVSVLTIFDSRIDLYVSLAENGYSEAANLFSVSALLLLALALSLIDIESNCPQVNFLDESDVHIMVLVRRSILIAMCCLVSLSAIPEIALRLFDFNIVLIPIIAAIFFSAFWLAASEKITAFMDWRNCLCFHFS